jgi:hypothetical protein
LRHVAPAIERDKAEALMHNCVMNTPEQPNQLIEERAGELTGKIFVLVLTAVLVWAGLQWPRN